MSSTTTPGPEMARDGDVPLEAALQDEGRTLMVVGGVLAVLGIGAMLFPLLTSLSVGIFFGAALVLAGVAHVAHAFSASGWKGAIGELLLAAVVLVAGLAMLFNPVLALTTLTLLLIGYFLAEGIALIVLAWSVRPEGGWMWPVVSGVLSFVLAGLLFVGFPATAAWALGLYFGINLFTTGVSMIVLGRAASTEATAPRAEAPRPDAGV